MLFDAFWTLLSAAISPATPLALKKAGAEGVAQRALDKGMAYEPLHRPRTLQNATKLLQNIQRQLLMVESEEASEGEVVDDYAASMSEEDVRPFDLKVWQNIGWSILS